ncbi:dihydrolipoyl dehydrogenase [Marinactinospora rubrisoli]|uniref:Dihydrolipoyl dehydrogenase n=1 Tax=Marinactinospora rubrisoli TaxID=2715399 RepID=A0ABW2KP28_9ACTN
MRAHYNVLVLGAGPGGYVAAIRAAQLGLTTAVVEERYWGGVCLNVGCIPSKALLRNAELAYTLTHEAKTFGIGGADGLTFDYGAAFQRSRKVADGRVKGVHFLMKKNEITEYTGRGTFVDDHTLPVRTASGTETVTFDNAIIATGASANLLPGTALSDRVVTYEEQILSDRLPGSVIIVGAGAIGIEFGYVLRNYGVDVTIVEFLDRVAPTEDEEVSAELAKQYRRLGVKVLTSTRVESIDDSGDRVRAVVASGDGETRTLEADSVLQAIGFAPNVAGYGLDRTGVKLTERGAIDVDGRGRTSVPHIYAIGDVTAKLMLAHAAEAMGIIAAETIAGAETQEIDFRMVPRATYCQPQIASFGYTEAQAREAGFDVRVAKFPFTANGKAHGLGDTRGFVKILSDARYGELLGAHMIGPEVTELLPELTLAQQWDLTVHEVARNVHAHPSLSEAVKEAVHGLAGHMINF